jgi:uncharacterized membrane protein YgcG
MAVTETIAVMVYGFEIKHGIFRDFPTKYKDSEGRTVTVWFKLLEVRRDGAAEPYEVERKLNGVSIRIGDGEQYLEHGEHVYTIRYETNRQLGFFEGFDELYWNVTGNSWPFTISQASAEVILPAGVDMGQVRALAFTGSYGTHGNACTSSVDGNRVRFQTTRVLDRNEGLTIVTQWPAGVVARPTPAQRAGYWFTEYLLLLLTLLGIIVTLAYYFLTWLRVGVDPHGGFIVPESTPPNGLSPAALRYIRTMSADRKCFTATLISMATRGYLTITEPEGGGYILTQTGANEDQLKEEEAALALVLFTGGAAFTISQDNCTKLQNAQAALGRSLRQQFEGVYFNRNARQLWTGVLLASTFEVLVLLALLVPHTAYQILALAGGMACHLALLAIFAALLPAYTQLGRAFLDRIEGFKLALAGGLDSLGEVHPGSPVLVEANLPYAIALEVHTEWSRRFEQALKLEQQRLDQPYQGYHPVWYMGNWSQFERSGSNDFSSFSSQFTSSFNSQISSSSTPPGSSSGGSGGFSGGGGGGGGGGGW